MTFAWPQSWTACARHLVCAVLLGLSVACGAGSTHDCRTDGEVAELFEQGALHEGAYLAGPEITDASLHLLAGPWRMPSLVLRGTTQVTDEGLLAFGKTPNSLSYLSLMTVPRLTSRGLEAFTVRSSVEELALGYLSGGAELFITASKMPGLRILRVTHCPGMNDEALAALEGHATLTILQLWDCPVSAQAIERFRETTPGCKLAIVGES